MPNSNRFRDLRSRITKLRNHLLPKTFDPTGTYTERQFDRARAFRLLAHAEIEWYLEEITFETANIAFDKWITHGWITQPLLAMVAYAGVDLGGMPNSNQQGTIRDLDWRVEQSKNGFNRYAKSGNHGIKIDNIFKLLLPVGIRESDIDQTWLYTTHSFGRLRGETAHLSNQVNHPPDPKTDVDTVRQILEGLSKIDQKLLELHSH